MELTDDNLLDYPFLYLIEPGGLVFSEEEIHGLRRYCLNGGFLMIDDFWGRLKEMGFRHKQVVREKYEFAREVTKKSVALTDEQKKLIMEKAKKFSKD